LEFKLQKVTEVYVATSRLSNLTSSSKIKRSKVRLLFEQWKY